MNIAEKILRAKADYDAVFEAGKNAVGEVLKFTDVSSTAYRSIVPNGVEPFARVNKIGGMSYKTRNLIPFPYAYKSHTRYGVDIVVSDDGTVTFNGTATADSNYDFFNNSNANPISVNGKYTVSGLTSGSDATYYIQTYIDGKSQEPIYTSAKTYTWNGDLTRIVLFFKSGTVFNGLSIRLMLNEGTTALPYEPYFEGLRSASVSELKSEFGNLFDYDNIIDTAKGTGEYWGKIHVKSTGFSYNLYTGTNGSTAKVPKEYWNKLMYLTAGTYYAYFDMDFYEDEVPDEDKCMQARSIINNGEDFWCGRGSDKLKSGDTFTMYEDGYCYLRRSYNKRCIISNLMITRTPRTDYVPHKDERLIIPEPIKNLDGYGLGKNADEYNYIDFGNKIFNQEYAEVRLPSNKGAMNTDANWYYIPKVDLGISPLNRDVLCNLLPSADIVSNSNISGIYMSVSPMNYVLIRKTEFTTEAEYRQWLSDNEVYIIERLAEPIETDISAYLTDEYIEVEGGGTVTAVNEYGYDAPTNISYLIDTQGG